VWYSRWGKRTPAPTCSNETSVTWDTHGCPRTEPARPQRPRGRKHKKRGRTCHSIFNSAKSNTGAPRRIVICHDGPHLAIGESQAGEIKLANAKLGLGMRSVRGAAARASMNILSFHRDVRRRGNMSIFLWLRKAWYDGREWSITENQRQVPKVVR
jgi:hypothetical protein